MKPSQVAQSLEFLIKLQRPCFIWGAPGIGKSDVVAQVAAKLKLKLIDVRLSLLDPVDLKGFPTPNKKGSKDVMSWLPPDFLPNSGKGVLFLDEMNSAPPSVQAAAYQLILNRRIGDYELPPGWSIVAAGNRTSDRSVVHAMPAALANRFIHIDFQTDPDEWIQWGIKNGISDLTRGYIRYRPGNLETRELTSGMRAFPSPRTWSFADKVVQSGLAVETEIELLNGTVGEGAAAEYIGFVREAKNLPSIDKILLAPDSTPVPTSPSTCHAIVAALESHATPANLATLLKYVCRMEKEFEVVFMSSIAKVSDELCDTEAFISWGRANRDIIA